MMRKTLVRTAAPSVVLLGLLLGGAVTARAGDDRPLKDDQCLSQCDADSDKCMASAGKDKDKQASCDKTYDQCLAKCGN